MNTKKAVCFGEILWDVFPDEERIGGAPLNVASRLSSFGIHTKMLSKIGKDERGQKLLTYLKNNNVDTKHVSEDENLSTGIVQVSLSPSGSASYEINYPSAWDKINISKEMKQSVKEADAFIFGSLVCRDEVSRSTLFALLPLAKYKILDINLRPPHYRKEILLKLMQLADFIKFNDEELFEIAALLGSKYNSLEQNLNFIAEKFLASSICVTKGSYGAVFMNNGNLFYNSGFKIKVKDTVGAGDSFLATLIAKLLQGKKEQEALNYACALGALVAAKEGANPEISDEEIENFIHPE
ncbi:carbohydrate kinase [Zunongwangia sp. H14]|uniref:carbohydrate kinase family protein n=1 Tax=Zunongwangia sp. H14 TaxID=3240792 RepID=UPI003565E874